MTSIHRATIRNFDPATYRADLELTGAPTALLTSVPVATNLPAALLTAGSHVLVLLSPLGNPNECVVLAGLP
ncbi:MAG TPA: hypothetical protein PLJ35_15200 [Anaerolineae bacterium]|nr:hypothetical protein [Anaerolineae bacterium]HPL27453.1 hypothetical protein [Anaerolineae bacterium]